MKRISFSFMWSDKLGEAIKERAKEQCPNGYSIECHFNSSDFEFIQKAVNKGIDSHLEAIMFTQGMGEHGRSAMNITPETLHVLVRRLMEMDCDEERREKGDSPEQLASCICETLEIELI